MSIELENSDVVQAQLRAMTEKALKALSAGVVQEAERIMTKSKRIVPVDLGPLRASAFVDEPVLAGPVVGVALGYGGDAKAYALIQHEREDFSHPGQGTAKYLERPVNEAKKGYGARIARTIGRNLV